MGGLFLWMAMFVLFSIIGWLGAGIVTAIFKDDGDGRAFVVILFAFCATELLFKNGLF